METEPAFKKSASVVLVRAREKQSDPDDVEVLLCQRNPEGEFSGKLVFPGGHLDEGDQRHVWRKEYPTFFSQFEDFHDFPLRICAIRELYEETGLLLSSTDQQQKLAKTQVGERTQRKRSIAQVFKKQGIEPALERLYAFKNWVSSPFNGYRWQVQFYLCFLEPEEEELLSLNSEHVKSQWVSLRTFFDKVHMRIVAPQYYVMFLLSCFKNREELLKQAAVLDRSLISRIGLTMSMFELYKMEKNPLGKIERTYTTQYFHNEWDERPDNERDCVIQNQLPLNGNEKPEELAKKLGNII